MDIEPGDIVIVDQAKLSKSLEAHAAWGNRSTSRPAIIIYTTNRMLSIIPLTTQPPKPSEPAYELPIAGGIRKKSWLKPMYMQPIYTDAILSKIGSLSELQKQEAFGWLSTWIDSPEEAKVNEI